MTGGIVVWVTGDGKITYKDSYQDAVERLCQLEDKCQPGERYTIRLKDGTAFPRRGIELVMGRLKHYERKENENDR